jgi:fatty-acyl-CoA synthase
MTTGLQSFAQSIAAQALRSGAKTAAWFDGQSFTYQDLAYRIQRAASQLAHVWHVEPGARVAYLGANHLDCLTLLAACEYAQAIYCPLNYRLAPTELDLILSDAQPAVLLADAAHLPLARSLAANVRCACHPIEALAACADDLPMPMLPAKDRDVLLVYTSGTTGRPKGVVHTVHAMAANIAASAQGQALQQDDVVLCTLPLFHVGGLCIQTLPAWASGAQIVLHPRFDAAAWLDAVSVHRVTQALVVPATMQAVIEHPAWGGTHLDSLRAVAAGSSTIALSLIEAFHARGVPVMQVYGSTETGPTSTVLPRTSAMAKAGCAGWPARDVEIRINAPDAQGIGEVHVRGPNVMRYYFGTPQSGLTALDAQGWFATGDLGRLDEEGALWIMGRAKDMLISGGENIYPAELENVLASVSAIAQAAVVGLPDPRWGEVPVACVVAKPGAPLDAAAVLAAFDGRLARFKHPKRVVFLDDLPKNAMGKVEKAHLVKIVSALQASSAPG